MVSLTASLPIREPAPAGSSTNPLKGWEAPRGKHFLLNHPGDTQAWSLLCLTRDCGPWEPATAMLLCLLKVERLQVVLGTILCCKMKGPVGIFVVPIGRGMYNNTVFCLFFFKVWGGGMENRASGKAPGCVPHGSCQPQAEPSLPSEDSIS